MKKYLNLLLFVGMLFIPFIVQAQYDPHKRSTTTSADPFVVDVIRFILQIVNFLIGVWVLYILLIVIIAAILFFTSGGDENRMDTAISWWKKCAMGIILAPITYVIVNLINNRLLG